MAAMNEQKSFTLIELLVVIVIIGILAGVIMISTSSSIDKANITKLKTFSESIKNNLMLNLVSEWSFDNGPTISGIVTDEDVKDVWGDNHASATGHEPSIVEKNQCVSDKCLYFSSGKYLSINQNNSLNLSNLTLEFWINPTIWGAWENLFNNGQILVFHRGEWAGDVIYFEYKINEQTDPGCSSWYGWAATKTSTYLLLNNWYHVVGIKNGDQLRIFLNGKEESRECCLNCLSGYTQVTTSSNLLISENGFNGKLDDIRIYNEALSDAEVKNLYIAGLNSMLSNGTISKEEYGKRIKNLSAK